MAVLLLLLSINEILSLTFILVATEEISWSNIIFRAGTVTALHPVDYCKTLIQLGYEPIAAKPTRTFFGRPALGLPSVFQYSKES